MPTSLDNLAFDSRDNLYVSNMANNAIYKVDVSMPASPLPCAQSYSSSAEDQFTVTFNYNGLPVGPLAVKPAAAPAAAPSSAPSGTSEVANPIE